MRSDTLSAFCRSGSATTCAMKCAFHHHGSIGILFPSAAGMVAHLGERVLPKVGQHEHAPALHLLLAVVDLMGVWGGKLAGERDGRVGCHSSPAQCCRGHTLTWLGGAVWCGSVAQNVHKEPTHATYHGVEGLHVRADLQAGTRMDGHRLPCCLLNGVPAAWPPHTKDKDATNLLHLALQLDSPPAPRARRSPGRSAGSCAATWPRRLGTECGKGHNTSPGENIISWVCPGQVG